jgi:hypothetical protein
MSRYQVILVRDDDRSEFINSETGEALQPDSLLLFESETPELAEAFVAGVEFVNDSSIEVAVRVAKEEA